MYTTPIPRPNRRSAYLEWADYIELRALLAIDGVISKSEVIDIRAEDQMTEGSMSSGVYNRSDALDAEYEVVDDYFRYIVHRVELFGQFYPFVLSDDEASLHRIDALSSNHQMYVYLLIISNLTNLADKSLGATLTNDFERISKVVLKNILPSFEHLYLFHPRFHEVEGNIYNRLQWLSRGLNEECRVSSNEYPTTDSGDKGVDIIGWYSFGDDLPGLPVLFAQCGCGSKWLDKQHEAAKERWRHRITIRADYWLFMFIPRSYRNPQGDWYQKGEVSSVILVDRFRILNILTDTDILPESSKQIVNAILNIKIDYLGEAIET